MANSRVSRTALGAAICRLIVQYQPVATRLFDDPVVAFLVSRPLRLVLRLAAMRRLTVQQTEAVAPGIYGTQVCRTCAIDDIAQAALAQGVAQLVLLGAGYDTRPYRLPQIERIAVFEVDLPAIQAEKRAKLQRYLGHLPDQLTFLPLDFERQRLEAAFAGTAFQASLPTLFVWEGVSQYLSEAAVRQTLAFVGSAAPGSVLACTYVLQSVIERRSDIPGAERLMDRLAQQAQWRFGLEPEQLPTFLAPYSLRLVEDIGSSEYQQRYLAPLGRKLVVFAGERVLHARVEA